ncbi:hypothetical protein M011DRAFT_437110 [Sporormia fimetaria CBS 119925]|uniref:Dynactin subunit 2 n=1 Tax=Sporormia fimetaria CBS 119925 TaxID=1340428 RepID=A0A6A6VJC9_9PLEO|nr:hypothetical protein M011DRAFT_437110 [Sporormia fimetaria CBS 119925]
MSEATKPKYDSLPGIDNSPDVYETPELDHETSTIQASTTVSGSEGESDDEDSAIQRQRLQTDEARARFRPSRVDARGVDFSDNVAAQRRSYRTYTNRQRRREEYLGEDGKEVYQLKLARLKREVAELEAEYNARLQSGDESQYLQKDVKEIIEQTSEKLDFIVTTRRGGVKGAEPLLDKTMQQFKNYQPFGPSKTITDAIAKKPPLPGSQIQKSQLDFVMNQAADFDKRLTELEKSLGLNGNTMPDLADKAPFPVFTTLERLEMTIATVAGASSGELDVAAQQVKKLIADAERLKELRAEAAQSPNPETKSPFTVEQESKINALYGTLPSIEKLSPLLPMTLEHLRSLQLVHFAAVDADAVVKGLEDSLALQAKEMKTWEADLQKMEKKMRDYEQNLEGNVGKITGWVKEVEERVAKLQEGGAE